jgi:hypothetical protein
MTRNKMPSSLASFAEFDALLAKARTQVGEMLATEPDGGAIRSVERQLDLLHAWTRGGRCPDQSEKDQLNFGHIASRELDDYPVAGALYELASFVIYWGEPQGSKG